MTVRRDLKEKCQKKSITTEENACDSSSKKKRRTNVDEYNIESLLQKKGSKYLVKWESYSEDYNSWEPKTSIPEFILQYYESDLSRLGKSPPSGFQQMEVEEEEYIVEKILDERIKKGKFEYL